MAKAKIKAKTKKCKAGWQCGKGCISRKKTCRKNLKNKKGKFIAQTYADYVISLAVQNVQEGKPAGEGLPTPDIAPEDILQDDPLGPEKPGDSPAKDPKEAAFREFEKSVQGDKTETGAIFDENGKKVWEKKGDEKSVRVDDIDAMPWGETDGYTLTHNHPDHLVNLPDGGTLNVPAGSFSGADLSVAIRNNLAGMRAVDAEYIHELKRPEGKQNYSSKNDPWGEIESYDLASNIGDEHRQLYLKNVRGEMKDQWLAESEAYANENAGMDEAELKKNLLAIDYRWRAEALHQANVQLAEKYGYEYSRRPIED